MDYDYGTLYGVNGIDPPNSHVYLSWMPTGTNALTVSESLYRTDTSLFSPLLYLEDNYGLREFVFQAVDKLEIYNVNLGNGTGTASISFLGQVDTSVGHGIGIKRGGSDLYYVYHTETLETVDDYTVDFRRESCSSGGSVDESLFSVTIPRSTNDDFYGSTRVIGKKFYYSIAHKQTIRVGEPGKWRNGTIYFYCLDMESDTVSLVSTVTLPTLGGDEFYQYLFPFVVASLGDVKFCIDADTLTQQVGMGVEERQQALIIDGSTIINTSSLVSSSPMIGAYSYNYRDVIIYGSNPGSYWSYAVASASLSTSATDIHPDTVPILFSSLSVFPLIGRYPDYYWLDSNGRRTSAITLTGVNLIRTIFPTLDTINGSMYVTARMDDSSNRLLSVDAFSGEILDQFILPSFPFDNDTTGACFNHGNFFIQWHNALRVSYIVEVPPVVGVGIIENQILEMN